MTDLIMEQQRSNKQILLNYAGLAFQFLAAIGLATYAGGWADKWIKINFPLFIWLLPLIVIIGLIIKAMKDTSKK
jgi:Na+/glutamate symporter